MFYFEEAPRQLFETTLSGCPFGKAEQTAKERGRDERGGTKGMRDREGESVHRGLTSENRAAAGKNGSSGCYRVERARRNNGGSRSWRKLAIVSPGKIRFPLFVSSEDAVYLDSDTFLDAMEERTGKV